MTDPVLESLMAAVVAEPDSDLHRLAYADRCLELGDDDRADFIRVQLRLGQGCKVCDGTGRNVVSPCPCALPRHRERRLIEANPGWYVLPPGGRLTTGLRRGFIAWVSLSCDDWLRDGPLLARGAPLERVRLTDKQPYFTFTRLWGWSRLEQDRDAGSPAYLPPALYDLLPGPDEIAPPVGLWRTENRAEDALSAAALAWARAAAPEAAAP